MSKEITTFKEDQNEAWGEIFQGGKPKQGSLLERLIQDAIDAPQDTVVFQTAHFPLAYGMPSSFGREIAWAATERWGAFTQESVKYTNAVARALIPTKKKIKVAIIADDCIYRKDVVYTDERIERMRDRFYQATSKPHAHLKVPGPWFSPNLSRARLLHRLVRHDHGVEGRRECVYGSEAILRRAPLQIENNCARAYAAFVRQTVQDAYLVSFIPWACKVPVLDIAVDRHIPALSASHVLMHTGPKLVDATAIHASGIGYRKD